MYGAETLYGLIGLAIANITAIIITTIREGRRKRKQESNGEVLSSIDQKLDTLTVSTAQIRTEIKSIKQNCSRTTSRFSKEITENREKIFSLARNNKKK